MPLSFPRFRYSAVVSSLSTVALLAGLQSGLVLAQANANGPEIYVGADAEALRQCTEELQSTTSKLFREGKFAEAIISAKQVSELRKQLFGESHPSYAASLNNLGEL